MLYLRLLQFLVLAKYQNYFIQAIIVRVSGLVCEINDPLFVNFARCELKPVSRGVKEAYIEAQLLQKPVNNVTLRFEIRRRSYSYTPLYSYEIDGCAFFRNKRRNPLASMSYEFLNIGKYSNINHTCPYNHDVIVSGLRIDRNTTLRLPIDKGNYVFHTYWMAYNVLRATVKGYVQLED